MTEQVSPATVPPVAPPQAVSPSPSAAVVETAAPSVNVEPSAAVVEAVKAPVAAEVAPITTLLEEVAPKIEQIKTAEDKKEAPDGAKPAETNKEDGSQSEKTAQLPSYEDFKLPEGFSHDKEKLSDFVKELGELQNKTKAEQKVMQEFGQKLMDKYVVEVQSVIKQVQDQNSAAQKAKVDGWKSETEKLADKDTVLTSAGKSLSYLPDELKTEFKKFYTETGIGNNATLLRTLAHYESVISNYKNSIRKYETEDGVKILQATVPLEKPKGMANKMYGNMNK